MALNQDRAHHQGPAFSATIKTKFEKLWLKFTDHTTRTKDRLAILEQLRTQKFQGCMFLVSPRGKRFLMPVEYRAWLTAALSNLTTISKQAAYALADHHTGSTSGTRPNSLVLDIQIGLQYLLPKQITPTVKNHIVQSLFDFYLDPEKRKFRLEKLIKQTRENE